MDIGVSYEFPSITKAAEFLKVTISFLSRCVREGKICKKYDITRKNRKLGGIYYRNRQLKRYSIIEDYIYI
jgi:hypothetical protein